MKASTSLRAATISAGVGLKSTYPSAHSATAIQLGISLRRLGYRPKNSRSAARRTGLGTSAAGLVGVLGTVGCTSSVIAPSAPSRRLLDSRLVPTASLSASIDKSLKTVPCSVFAVLGDTGEAGVTNRVSP